MCVIIIIIIIIIVVSSYGLNNYMFFVRFTIQVLVMTQYANRFPPPNITYIRSRIAIIFPWSILLCFVLAVDCKQIGDNRLETNREASGF